MVRFGPSGNDISFYEQGHKSSIEAPAWLAGLGLSAFEVNFGRGIKMGEKMAVRLGEEARKHNIAISFHAPYFINLASADSVAIKKSYAYIEKCLEIAKMVDDAAAKRVVVHVGSQCALTREEAIINCKKNLKWVVAELEQKGFDNFFICIETMGRYKAIGTYQEICEICKECGSRVIPTLDFGHINCVEQGELQRNPQRMRDIVEYCIKEIGLEKMRYVHIHFSAIEYTKNGERAHTILADRKWSFSFEPLARVIRDKGLEPTIICESKEIMAQDAGMLANVYNSLI